MHEGERRVAVVIEDDVDIRYLLEQVLVQAGFETVTTGNGEDGLRAVAAFDPVITTLDLSLPGIDGFEVARRIRASSDSYIVMISARDEEIDMLQGLDAGADDFLTKPFRPRELRARITAMLRRPRVTESNAVAPPSSSPDASVEVHAIRQENGSVETGPMTSAAAPRSAPAWAPRSPVQPAAPPVPPSAVDDEDGWTAHNGLRIHLDARLVEVDGENVELTRSEFDLIAALMESRRRVRTKADLALVLRGDPYVTTHFVGEADRRNVEVHMANLRRKLGDSANTQRFVVTVRGVGYRLTGPGDPGFVTQR